MDVPERCAFLMIEAPLQGLRASAGTHPLPSSLAQSIRANQFHLAKLIIYKIS